MTLSGCSPVDGVLENVAFKAADLPFKMFLFDVELLFCRGLQECIITNIPKSYETPPCLVPILSQTFMRDILAQSLLPIWVMYAL